MKTIHAVYENGVFRPLEPVEQGDEAESRKGPAGDLVDRVTRPGGEVGAISWLLRAIARQVHAFPNQRRLVQGPADSTAIIRPIGRIPGGDSGPRSPRTIAVPAGRRRRGVLLVRLGRTECDHAWPSRAPLSVRSSSRRSRTPARRTRTGTATPVHERSTASCGSWTTTTSSPRWPAGQAVRERAAGGRYDGLDGPGLAGADARPPGRQPRPPPPRRVFGRDAAAGAAGGRPAHPAAGGDGGDAQGPRRDNYGFKKVEILEGNLGYIRLDLFTPPEFAADTYAAAMTFVAQTDALIIDLRHNGGSIHPDAVPLLVQLLLRPAGPTSRPLLAARQPDGGVLDPGGGPRQEVPGPADLPADQPPDLLRGRAVRLRPEEPEASEGRRRHDRGGANGGGTRRVDDHFSVWIPVGRAINPITGTDWEGTGSHPTCPCRPRRPSWRPGWPPSGT